MKRKVLVKLDHYLEKLEQFISKLRVVVFDEYWKV